jgi:ferredoxin
MSVEIKFEPDGPHGLVAEGTFVGDAAKRLGFRIPAECEGRGECDTCAVTVITGATLLSSLTEGERKQLSPERLAGGERLACQCKLERGGELLLKLVPQTERAPTADERARDLRKDFSALPFDRKIVTLVQLETIATAQALNKIANSPFFFGGKVLDRLAGYGRKLNRQKTAPPPRSGQDDKK